MKEGETEGGRINEKGDDKRERGGRGEESR